MKSHSCCCRKYWHFVLILSNVCSILSLRPTPQIQTPVQAAIWSRKASLAAALSSSALPTLLAHIGSNRSRVLLANDCPELANATAEQILDRLLAELEVAELVESLGSGQYQTLPQLFETNFLYNIWEAQFNFTKRECQSAENWNEEHIFGLPGFTRCPPTNWTEAQNRLYYVSLNFQKLPMGYTFDDLSLVFNRTYARNLTLIAPIDTGHWYRCAFKRNMTAPINCTGWDLSVGTLADMNHLFMATYYLQRGPVTPSAFFPRIDCTSAAAAGGGTRVIGNGLPYSSSSVYPYFESNIVGSINFPMGVGYVLAPFLSYWGSKLGLQLQEWCKRWGFPLFWAPCAVSSRYSCALETSHPRQAWRVLDPGVANTSRLNVTVMAGMTDVSARLWSAVETLPVNVSKQVRETFMKEVWTNLTLAAANSTTSLLLRPLSANDCSQPDWCVGVELRRVNSNVTTSGRCVCRV